MTEGKRRRGLAAAAALLGGVLVLLACSGDGDNGGSARAAKKSQAQVDEAAAKDDLRGPNIDHAQERRGQREHQQRRQSHRQRGQAHRGDHDRRRTAPRVEGTLAADGKSWKPDGAARARHEVQDHRDGQGRRGPRGRTRTPRSPPSRPTNSFIGNFTPEDGTTVGVGMPVSINFDKAITDKKAVQSGDQGHVAAAARRSSATGSTTQRLDFRPEEYWKAGSKVTLKLNLDGVEGADGVFGVQQKTVTFNDRPQPGQHRRRRRAKTMTVVRDGKTIKTIPISAGSAENPTYNGQMVISEKFKETRMNGATVGFTDDDGKGEYDIKDVPHAMRLSTSGTFIHGNYWGADSIFGSANTSHGCVGLNDAKGAGDAEQPTAPGSSTTR